MPEEENHYEMLKYEALKRQQQEEAYAAYMVEQSKQKQFEMTCEEQVIEMAEYYNNRYHDMYSF